MNNKMRRIAVIGLAMAVLPVLAQEARLAPIPKLSGKECIRDLCLGDELGKFKPGYFQHNMRLVPPTFRKQADVLKEMGTLYTKASDKTLELISREVHARASHVSMIPLTPEIHEALLTDQVHVCSFLDLVSAVEGRSPEKWEVTFRAMPGQFVDMRQAWVITEIKAEIPGVFPPVEVQKLRKDLDGRTKFPTFSSVIEGTSELYLKLGWFPLKQPGSNSDAKGMPSPQSRVIYGCDSLSKLPSF